MVPQPRLKLDSPEAIIGPRTSSLNPDFGPVVPIPTCPSDSMENNELVPLPASVIPKAP